MTLQDWPNCVIYLFSLREDDGAVRVWRNYCGDEESRRLTLVTAWTALSGMIPSQRGVLYTFSFFFLLFFLF